MTGAEFLNKSAGVERGLTRFSGPRWTAQRKEVAIKEVVEKKRPLVAVAHEFKIGEEELGRWIERYRAGGLDALKRRSLQRPTPSGKMTRNG